MSMDQKVQLTFEAQLKIGQMNSALKSFQSNLNNLKVPNQLFGSMTKDITKLEGYIKEFQTLTSKTEFSNSDMNNIVKVYEKIQTLSKSLDIDFKNLSGIDVNKLMPPEVQERFQKLSNLLTEIQTLSDFKTNLPNQLKDLGQAAAESEAKVAELKKELDELDKKKTTTHDKLVSNSVEQRAVEKEIKMLEKRKAALEEPRGKESDQYKKNEKELNDLQTKAEKLRVTIDGLKQQLNLTSANTKAGTGLQTKIKNSEIDLNQTEAEITKLKSLQNSLSHQKSGTSLKEYKEIETALENNIRKLEELKLKQKELNNEQTKNTKTYDNKAAEYEAEKQALNQIKQQMDELNSGNFEASKLQEVRQALADLMGVDISQIPTDLEKVQELTSSLSADQLETVRSVLKSLGVDVESFKQGMTGVKPEIDKNTHAMEEFNARASDVSALKSRIQYLLGLNNMINLTRRAIRSAFNTIKDLDKAMTETAVVTNFTVSDMWKQLPEYTKRANELGVTTQQAYESATLFYQQGLNTKQAAELSTETLKMARIAGLDAAEATDRMTNALRGFNMELDAQSAQRVDDVYSQLAANTASNVDEISTAMTKVASLAHSTNSEFETTAAFLAQIIETTRESAETAGTALKTVYARFSEVKKLYSEDQLKGTDEEGGVIDVNKVSTALRSAGIDLNKYFLGEVGLDDIFMELASKWDSLTSVQQRYIATQAAGSRQQSRFIALMQDYARTQELVSLAYNANGASAKQFEKTQESLQSKLARLKNAWDEFLMGITNSNVVKKAVDFLTLLLNGINKLTDAFGEGASGIVKFTIALTALSTLKKIFFGQGIFGSVISGLGMATKTGATTKGAGILTGLLGGSAKGGMHLAGAAGTTGIAGTAAKTGLIAGLGGNIASFGKKAWNTAGAIGSIYGLQGIGAGLAGIATALGAIAVAVGVVIAAYQAWLRITPEGKLKQTKEYAKTMQTVATATQNAAKSAKEAESKYGEFTQKIDSATSVLDRGKAIQERNEYISELLKSNPSLAEHVTTTTEGSQLKLEIDESVLSDAAKAAEKGALQASSDANLANALQSGAQANVYDTRIARIRFNAAYEERELTQAEQAQIKQYEVSTQQSNAEMRSYAKMAYQQQLQGKDLTDEVVNLTSDFLADSFNAQDYLKDVNSKRWDNWWGRQATKESLRAEYKNLYGTEADASMGRKELAQAVAVRQVDQDKQANTTDQLTKLLSGGGGEIYKAMLEAYNGTGKAAEVNLTDVNLDAENLDISKVLGLSVVEANFKTLAEITGVDADKIKEHMLAQAKANKLIQQQTKSKLFESALKNGVTIDTQLQNQIQSLKPQIANLISNVATQATDILSQEDMGELFPQLLDMNEEQLGQFSNFFSNFNLDNPIDALDKLKQAQKDALTLSDDDPFKKMLGSIEKANAALFDTGNLVQNFVTSEAYDSLSDSIDDFIEKNGKVTAKNIEELAEECSDLKKILDNTTVSAQGLAEAFTLLEKSNTPIDTITSSLLAALSAGESFDTLMDKVQGWIDDFDEGIDMAQGTEHIIDVLGKAETYVQDWQFGNKPLQNIYDHIFGEGKYNKYMEEAYKKGLGFDEIETKLQSDIDHIKKLAEDEGKGALDVLAEQNKVIKNENGKYTWDLSQYATAADPVQAAIHDIATSLGVADDAARAFIEGWGSHMWDLGQEWDKLQFDEKIKAFVQDLGDGLFITQQELDTLAAATGKEADEIEDALKKVRTAADKPVLIKVNWQNEDGQSLSGTELLNKFREQFNISTKDIDIRYGQGRQYFDYTEFTKDFQNALVNGIDAAKLNEHLTQNLKLTQAQATEILNDIAANGEKLTKNIEIPVVVKADDGSIEVTHDTITVSGDSMADLTAAENLAMEKADYEAVGKMLAETPLEQLTTNVGTAISNGAGDGIAGIQQALDSAGLHATVSLTASGISGILGLFQHDVKGAIVKSYAKGSENFHVSPGTALTGEEGPELVWNKEGGYAYLTGQKGPEFQDLQPGDRIFNANETKKILHNSAATGGIIPSYVGGNGTASGGWKTGPAAGGGGSGDKDEDDEWKNEIDWLYNVVQNIEELERQQNKLQEKYNDLLTDQTKTGHDLYKTLIEQMGNLYAQLDHQTYALEKREQEMREFMDTTNDMDEYLWYNWEDRTIEIDWDKIDQITDEEQYSHVKELIDQAEDIQSKMDDAEDAIIDINNSIQELENIWRDTFRDFEDRVLKAIVKMYQTVIDNYSELNDTLNNSNTAILEAINKEISLQRQIRDNTKTEEEIANDEAQLAYLRRDTTGGNDLAALQLEKSLADARQDYEDNLVDQAVQRLQDDNDAAAEQREKQIEIMQAQLDYQSENGEFNAYLKELLDSSMNGDGHLATDSDLYKLLAEQENIAAMTKVGKEVWEEELNGTFKEVLAYLLKDQGEAEGTYFTAVTAAFNGLKDVYDKAYHGSYSQGTTYNGSSGNSGGSNGTNQPTTTPKTNTPPKTNNSDNLLDSYNAILDGNFSYVGSETYNDVVGQIKNSSNYTWDTKKQRYVKALKGGLFTSTGIMQIDGTAKEPEYVLNARQTEAFLKLADVLPAAMNNTSSSVSNTFGATTNNIVINVDKIDSDYSVDQMVDRVKEKLFESGSYRNNNVLNFLR